jgi:hypothetical protein
MRFTPPGFAAPCWIGLTAAWALTMALPRAWGADGDDTLRYYLSRSKLVVAGEIKTEPERVVEGEGIVRSRFEFQVSHHIAGPSTGPSIPVVVLRHERIGAGGVRPLEKKQSCILFLNPAVDWVTPTWESADVWFGVQENSNAMHTALTRLAKGAGPRIPQMSDSLDDLLAALKDYDLQIRTKAIDILGQKRERRAIGPLIELLADRRALDGSDNHVAGHASAALHQITGEPESIDQEKWKAWWKRTKAQKRTSGD